MPTEPETQSDQARSLIRQALHELTVGPDRIQLRTPAIELKRISVGSTIYGKTVCFGIVPEFLISYYIASFSLRDAIISVCRAEDPMSTRARARAEDFLDIRPEQTAVLKILTNVIEFIVLDALASHCSDRLESQRRLDLARELTAAPDLLEIYHGQ